MAVPDSSSILLTVAIGVFIGWRVYSRARRMVGRQELSRVRPWITVMAFSILALLLLLNSLTQLGNALALITGMVVGTALGLLGLRLTTFENTSVGHFYTPNAHLGIALSLLMLGRVGYRFVQQYSMAGSLGASHFVTSPVTLFIFGTLAGYYVSYAIGLLRWRHGLNSISIMTHHD